MDGCRRAVVGAVIAAAAGALLLVGCSPAAQRDTSSIPSPGASSHSPVRSTSTPTSAQSTSARPMPALVDVQKPLGSRKVESLPRLDLGLPSVLDARTARRVARPLADDPLEHAIAVTQLSSEIPGQVVDNWSGVRIYFLGHDKRWRWLSAADFGLRGRAREGGTLIGEHALSPNGTKFAVADEARSRLVVADLTTGRIRMYAVPVRSPP